MKRETLTARELLLVVLGWVITIFFLISANAFWQTKIQRGLLFLILALGLTFVFFRKRKFVFAIIVCTFLLVNVGLTAFFHPTLIGFVVTMGSITCLYFLFRWQIKNYPNLSRKDMHTLFDHDPH